MPARPPAVVNALSAAPLTWSQAFPATAGEVPKARRFLATHTGHLPLADDAALCLSELVTNAIQHSNSSQPGGHLTVSIVLTPAVLLVEVSDQGGPWAPHPSTDGQDGRGLQIVSHLTTCWGTTPTPNGRIVWFTMLFGSPMSRAQDLAPVIYPHLTPDERSRFQYLQALEDAITYRADRLAAPCPRCGPTRCDDHATDTDLIAAYQHIAAALASQAPAPAPSPPSPSSATCGQAPR